MITDNDEIFAKILASLQAQQDVKEHHTDLIEHLNRILGSSTTT